MYLLKPLNSRNLERPAPSPAKLPRVSNFGQAAARFGAAWRRLMATLSVIARFARGSRQSSRQGRPATGTCPLGPYALLGKVGEGGAGSVYVARHRPSNALVALKLLRQADAAARVRFEREVRLTRLLEHPNIIRVYDQGESRDGQLYYAMEYVDGSSIEELVTRTGPQTPERVIRILQQVAAALVAAHDLGLAHRDLKPANILVYEHAGDSNRVKLVDFGLVKDARARDDVKVTAPNLVPGTPAYIAPELIVAPDRVDARADIYGLGGVAYFMLTGSPPFSGASALEVCVHQVHTPPAPPSTRSAQPIPKALERLVLACLSKLPEERPEARWLERALEALWQDSQHPECPRGGAVSSAAA